MARNKIILVVLLGAELVYGQVALKLKPYGWQPPPVKQTKELDAGKDSNLLCFDSRGGLLVGFPVEQRLGLVTRNLPALDFHIVRFTSEGQQSGTIVVPTNNWKRNGVYLDAADHLIVRTNDLIQRYTGDDTHDHSQSTWQTLAKCGARCELLQSPSRRVILLDKSSERQHDASEVLYSGSDSIKPCATPKYPIHSISDSFALFLNPSGTAGSFTNLYLWPLCQQVDPLTVPVSARGRATALTDSTFVIAGLRQIAVVSARQMVFAAGLQKNQLSGSRARGSANGEQFAIDISTFEGGSRALDISGHRSRHTITVYDIRGRPLTSIDVVPTQLYTFDFALSSDGRRLAVLVDDTVTMVDVKTNGSAHVNSLRIQKGPHDSE